jgi:hypothetical protein
LHAAQTHRDTKASKRAKPSAPATKAELLMHDY